MITNLLDILTYKCYNGNVELQKEEITMFIQPVDYMHQLEIRIAELEKELNEIKPIYEALKGKITGIAVKVAEAAETKNGEAENRESAGEMTTSEKIADTQRKRHRAERDKKLPYLKRHIERFGPSTLRSLLTATKVTPPAFKLIVEENPGVFKKNPHTNLWELCK